MHYDRVHNLSSALRKLATAPSTGGGMMSGAGRVLQGAGKGVARAGKGVVNSVNWAGGGQPFGVLAAGALGGLGVWNWAKKRPDTDPRGIVEEFGAQGPPNTRMMS